MYNDTVGLGVILFINPYDLIVKCKFCTVSKPLVMRAIKTGFQTNGQSNLVDQCKLIKRKLLERNFQSHQRFEFILACNPTKAIMYNHIAK